MNIFLIILSGISITAAFAILYNCIEKRDRPPLRVTILIVLWIGIACWGFGVAGKGLSETKHKERAIKDYLNGKYRIEYIQSQDTIISLK